MKRKRKITSKQFDDYLFRRKFESTKAAFLASILLEDHSIQLFSKSGSTRSKILSYKALRVRIAHIAAMRFMAKACDIYHYPYMDIEVSYTSESRYLFSHGKGYFFCHHENSKEGPRWERAEQIK